MDEALLSLTIINAIRSTSILWIGVKSRNLVCIFSAVTCFAGVQFIMQALLGQGALLPFSIIGFLIFFVSGLLNKGLSIKPGIWLKEDHHIPADIPKDPIILVTAIAFIMGSYLLCLFYIPLYYGRWLAGDPLCSSEELAEIVQNTKDEETLIKVVSHQNCSANILNLLCEYDGSDGFKFVIASNNKLPAACIQKLSNNNNIGILSAVARNENTPSIIIQEIFQKHDSYSIRLSIAGNPKTPKHILDELSKSEDINVLRALAGNPSSSESVVAYLFRHSDVCVRYESLKSIQSLEGETKEKVLYLLTSGHKISDPTIYVSSSQLFSECQKKIQSEIQAERNRW